MPRKKSTMELVGEDATAEKKQKKPRENKPKRSLLEMLRSRIFLGGVCVVAALLLAFVATPLIELNLSKTTPVVVLTRDVPLGTEITADMLAMREMGSINLPESALLHTENAVGRYLTVAAAGGDILAEARLTDRLPTDDPVLTTLPEGMMAVSANLSDLSQSVSGKLRAGDIIQIFAVLNHTNTPDNSNYHAMEVPELQRVEILAVSNADAVDIEDGQAGAEIESDRHISTVTLAVNTAQASALAGLNHMSTLHAALVVRGDVKAKAVALAQQESYFLQPDPPIEDVPDNGAEENPAQGGEAAPESVEGGGEGGGESA